MNAKSSKTDDSSPRSKGRRRRKRKRKFQFTGLLSQENLRYLMGLLLIIGIGGWIYYATVNPRKPKSAGTWAKTILPTADIDSPPTRQFENAETQAKEEPKNGSKKLEYFLAQATVDELIDEALDLRGTWTNNAIPIAYVIVLRRAKIARRLLNLEIDEKQRTFAYNEYIESITTLDGLNCEGKMGAPGIRGALIEIGDKFSDYSNPVISSKASLAFPLRHLHDYLESRDNQSLLAFDDAFSKHADAIMLDPVTTQLLIKLIFEIYVKSNFNESLKQCGIKVLHRLEQSEDAEIAKIATILREQIYFAKVELTSLVDRLQSDHENSREDVQDLFKSLEVNPNSRLEIYQIAVNTIVEYKRLNRMTDATKLTDWLEKINSKNEVEISKEKITRAILTLRK